MSNKGIIISVIIWMLFSLVWFLAGSVKGIIWLCVGACRVIHTLNKGIVNKFQLQGNGSAL